MSQLCRAIILITSFASVGCALNASERQWQRSVDRQVAQLGHRNWIIVSEASFPAHSREGINQVVAPAEIPEVLDYVLNSIEQHQQVYPEIYLTRELRALDQDYAPGIDQFRHEIKYALHGYKPTEIQQDSLMTLIESANQRFDVLVIRTATVLPYSSVFMELKPSYWDSDAENHLRQKISKQRTEKLAQPVP